MLKRVAVCIDSNIGTPILLRAAQRKAQYLRLPWVAIYVETPRYHQLGDEARERLLRFMTMAEQMDAELVHLSHKSAVSAVVDYVAGTFGGDAPIYHVIAGRIVGNGFLSSLRPGFAQRVAFRLRRHCEVHIIPLHHEAGTRHWHLISRQSRLRLKEAFVVVASVVGGMVLCELLAHLLLMYGITLRSVNVTMIFLMICTFIAVRFGFLASVLGSLLSIMVLIYFYTAPYQSFEISTVNDLLNLSLFFALALVISLIGAASRWDSENARIRERRSQAFFQINRLTNNAQTMDEAIQILHRTLSEMLEMDLAFFLPAVLNRELIKHVFPHDMKMSDETQKALEQSWREKKTTGIGTPDRYHTSWRFEPMVTHHGDVGVMGFKVPRHSHVDVSFGRLTGALADHCATIIERVEMARSIEASKLHDEREQLRSMLLSSVSHDLKTPLASIIGSLSVYHSMRDRLPEERLQMLTQTAFEEAQRLDSFITNILDMSRLESGNVTFKKEWVDPIELLLRVRKRMRQRLDGRVVTIQPSIEAIEIEVDVMMTEQVMQNILDNAIKYSPKGSEISISMFTTEQGFCIEVRDRGKGIPEEKHEMVFDKYSRLKMEDSLVAGTGLGLAISKKIIDAQEGSISITNHSEGGAIFALNFSRVRHVYPAAMANVL